MYNPDLFRIINMGDIGSIKEKIDIYEFIKNI